MKSKILLAVALLLAISTTSVWAADSSEKTNQKTGSYTNEDVWAAYEGFNNTLLDPDKYIYKTTSAYEQAVDRGHGAAAIWCQPIYWDMSMNAYKLAKALFFSITPMYGRATFVYQLLKATPHTVKMPSVRN